MNVNLIRKTSSNIVRNMVSLTIFKP